jgi:hypothetical protein
MKKAKAQLEIIRSKYTSTQFSSKRNSKQFLEQMKDYYMATTQFNSLLNQFAQNLVNEIMNFLKMKYPIEFAIFETSLKIFENTLEPEVKEK